MFLLLLILFLEKIKQIIRNCPRQTDAISQSELEAKTCIRRSVISANKKEKGPLLAGKHPAGASSRKHAISSKHRDTYNWCHAPENMQPVPSAGKHATCIKRGKTSSRCKARENTQPVQSVGRHAIDNKRGNLNLQPVPSA